MTHIIPTLTDSITTALSPDNFALTVFSVIGRIANFALNLLIIFLLFKLFFGRTVKLLRGKGHKVARRVFAAAVCVPLLTFWIHRVASGEADFKQWAAFIFLWLLIQYIPINLLQKFFEEHSFAEYDKAAAKKFKQAIRQAQKKQKRAERFEQKQAAKAMEAQNDQGDDPYEDDLDLGETVKSYVIYPDELPPLEELLKDENITYHVLRDGPLGNGTPADCA